MNGQGRKYLLKLIADVLLTPCLSNIKFVLTWATDQMTSFILPLRDFQYTICYYWNKRYDLDAPHQCGSKGFFRVVIIAAIPLILRQIQLLKQAYQNKGWTFKTKYNFGKYSVSLISVILSYLTTFNSNWFYLWFVFAIISTIYSYFWDIYVDWDLLKTKEKPRHRFLRSMLSYKSIHFYYIAMICDLALRLMWIVNMGQDVQELFFSSGIFSFFIGFLEMVRRCIWNFLRVEVEHIKNQSDFKAVESLNLPFQIDADEIDDDELLKQDLRRLRTGEQQRDNIYELQVNQPHRVNYNHQNRYEKYHRKIHNGQIGITKQKKLFINKKLESEQDGVNKKYKKTLSNVQEFSSQQQEISDIQSEGNHDDMSYSETGKSNHKTAQNSYHCKRQISGHNLSARQILQDVNVFPIKETILERRKINKIIDDISHNQSENGVYIDQIFDVRRRKSSMEQIRPQKEIYTKQLNKMKLYTQSKRQEDELLIKRIEKIKTSPSPLRYQSQKTYSSKKEKRKLKKMKSQDDKEKRIKSFALARQLTLTVLGKNKNVEFMRKADLALEQLVSLKWDEILDSQKILKLKYLEYETQLTHIINYIQKQKHDQYLIKKRPYIKKMKRKIKKDQ